MNVTANSRWSIAVVASCLALACGGGQVEQPPPASDPPPLAPEPLPPEPVAQPAPTPPPTPPAPPPGPRVDADALLAALGGAQMVEPAPGFPAISEDGSHVAFAFVDGDGGRGNTNLAVRFYRVQNGRKDKEISLLTPDEAEGGRTPAIEQQVRERAGQVATDLTAGNYHSMAFLVRFDGEQEGTVEGTAEGLKLTWDTARGDVVVANEAGGPPRFRRRLRGVRAHGPECPPLHDPLLRAAWVDTAAGALVLDVAFHGTDSCWEPADEITVARLRPSR